MDERIDVNRLDRCAGSKRAVASDSERTGSGDGQKRTQPLSAANGCVAHRLEEDVAAVIVRDEQCLEQVVHLAAYLACLGIQLRPQAVNRINRHRME